MSFSQDARTLFTFRDSPVRWPIALQAAIAIGLPTLGFALVGRADLGLLASSGGFLALYLSARSRRERALLLPIIGAGLVLSAAIGVLASGTLVGSLAALFLVTAAASVLSLGFGVGPPGVLFFVLVTGVSSRLAAPASLGGAALPGGLILGMFAIGTALAYLVVLAPLLLPGVRKRDATLHGNRVVLRFDLDPITRVIILRILIASAVAVVIAAPLGIHRVYWVLVSVVAILQNGHTIRLTAMRGIHRVLGTLVGVGVFALVLLWNPTGILVALLIMALQFVTEIVVIRNYGLALIFITPLALTIAAQGRSEPVGSVVVDRVTDTLIGAGIALVVLLIAHGVQRRRGRRGETPAEVV
ncbi:FUSC family protein [Glaciihabitans sp. dw_435]|uniref:FUSC family protein n=1 Tax=Glaciihabitans sp. dw_435 TaxID=2720081 RepID=UPI001BD32B73|nr:FUSC family protein [Glaciihabitans sp. dw_435]